MIKFSTNFAPVCQRALRLVALNSHNKDFSTTTPTNFAAKPGGVNIAGLGGKAAKKKLGKLGPATEKMVLPVETDTQILHDYVCGTNLLKEGGENIKLKEDSEYPEWLWTLRTGKFPELSEMDPETKEYWMKVRRMGVANNNKLLRNKRLK
ncbi:large ribosomal subunit protein mL54 [Neocloeon triangulifer]|uniref:large ribosomal subunit protein mL54 n=1 Tax=Neocloeon triangulifer TaxID=2078957 RepID=UPI00286F8D5B|nr:large ribosomal subunit protein mL54 [Neocloeon triangulifer]